ncbi:hypothetical protein L1987_13249 [Smallanthus sonchifolius]|uniref:Uncharacterized protein n=1 Tax=Smallanthus sonchifolius TaxID=185202 RepID=A0ACB9JI38_9ASTR|nr:hypothetical protein L1987_13249 [Smallanthus sonchifolius]
MLSTVSTAYTIIYSLTTRAPPPFATACCSATTSHKVHHSPLTAFPPFCHLPRSGPASGRPSTRETLLPDRISQTHRRHHCTPTSYSASRHVHPSMIDSRAWLARLYTPVGHRLATHGSVGGTRATAAAAVSALVAAPGRAEGEVRRAHLGVFLHVQAAPRRLDYSNNR